MPRLLRALPGLLLFACTVPAGAELVIFQDGRVVKAAGYRVAGEELEIEVPGGGSFRVEMGRVERIVEDEVVLLPAEVAEAIPSSSDVRYDLSYRRDRRPLFGSAYDAVIDAEARRYNLDASLVSAVIRAESNFAPRALSRKGARGLMQLMPATAQRLDVRRPYDPVSNVRGGVRYLRELAERFDHRPELVLAAYNAGENAVGTYGGVPPYRETVGYVKRILSWWKPAIAPVALAGAASASAITAPR